MTNQTTDSSLQSWVTVPSGSDFPIQNLPYGIFKVGNQTPRAGVAIGNRILDLAVVFDGGFLANLGLPAQNVFAADTLNAFIALGKPVWTAVRKRLTALLSQGNTEIQGLANALVNQSDAQLLLPIFVPDYTDFYSSAEHASNVGKMFRPDQAPLLPNWKHIPVGYHGRASSIFVSGTDFHRPKGQYKPPTADKPVFGPSKRLDIELEMAFVVGKGNEIGTSISVAEAEDHMFGMVLFNDYSARDIQNWEYVPLGPFLGKNFFSSISPWIVPMEALEPFRVAGPVQDVEVLDYLKFEGNRSFDIQLDVYLKPEGGTDSLICHSNHKYLYWNIAQQLAHHTVNGCNMRVGDLCASGTISAPDENGFGSLLELSWSGNKPLTLNDGSQRTFLEDNDSIRIKGYCQKDGLRIGFGEVVNKVLPAV